MAKKKKHSSNPVESEAGNKEKLARQEESQDFSAPWIPLRTGIILMSIVSIVLAVLTAIQVVPIKGMLEGILWGVAYGGGVWVIFLGFYFYYRIFRRG